MQVDWQAFLEHRGAELDSGLVKSYGNPTRELAVVLSGDVLSDLSHFGLLAVKGDDAKNFLHSQFINDVNKLESDHSQLNGYCNPKGRLIANFRLFMRGDTLYLRFPYELMETVQKKLEMFKLRSKVTLEDHSDDMVRIGFSGRTADKQLAELVDTLPASVNEVVHQDNLTIIRIPGITPSYELYADDATIRDIWTRLDVHGAPVGYEAWQLLEILAGMPHITEDTTEEYVPQMVNYQAIEGLSFTKGCYPGQEIVARMHYLGKLKKRMYLARVRSNELPTLQQECFSSQSSEGRVIGNVVNVAKHPDGDYAVLVVLQIKEAEGETIHLGSKTGPELAIQALPYPVELKKEK